MRAQGRGVFISLEGMDGAGKSSHLARLELWLKRKGFAVKLTREPGGTPLAEKLRELLLREDMLSQTEALLIYAARLEHVQHLIQPALEQGACVVSDRFEDSSFAYQAAAAGVGAERLEVLSRWCLSGFEPDLTLVFDLPIDESLRRIGARNEKGDRFERQGRGYLEKVRQGFLGRAQANPGRVKVIDSSVAHEEVWQSVERVVEKFFESRGRA